jgi:hypothetical protein
LQNKDYTKAKELYRAAIKAKPEDNNAIMEYAAAVIADIFGRDFSEIINDVIAHGERGMLAGMTPDRIAAADVVLYELVNDPGLLPAGLSRPITDNDTNLNGAAIYALAGVVHVLNNDAVRASGAINGAFRLDPDKIPRGDANVNAVLREMRMDLEIAGQLLNNITDKGPIVDNLAPRLNFYAGCRTAFLENKI